MDYSESRQQLLECIHRAVADGLIYLSAGNISVRVDEEYVAITPSGIKYDALQASDIAIINVAGQVVDAPVPPSSETPMHTAIYRAMPTVKAIVHTHSSYAITFAMLGKHVPVANLELYFVGAPIPVAPWACPGTDAAGTEATQLFLQAPRLKVMLLRNHGLVAIGQTLTDAYEAAFNAEQGLRSYHQALQIGQPASLTAQQITEIAAVYG